MFPDRSPRIRHRNELTERDWENAVQGLGKLLSYEVHVSYTRELFPVKLNALAPPTVWVSHCLVPVRRFPSPSRSIHFGDVSEANGRETHIFTFSIGPRDPKRFGRAE